MRMYTHRRLGLGTIMSAMIMLSVVAAFGTAALVLSNTNFTIFKTLLDQSYSNTISKNQESIVIENPVYHSSTNQFNLTFTNPSTTAINITNIKIISPKYTVTAIPSASIKNTNYVSVITSSANSTTYAIPGSIILPGQTYTSAIPYNCFTDPVSVSLTTSRGSVIKTQVAPNVGWYGGNWQYRKPITIDHNQVVGNPSPILLDFINSTTVTTSSNTLPSFSFPVGSGSNRLLLVAVESSSKTVSTITYGGLSLIKANSTANTVDSEIWYLANPPVGTANIIVTMSGSGSSNIITGAYSLFGVDQTYPISYGASSTSTLASGSVTVYTKNTQSLVINSIAVQNGPTISQNIGQTLGWNNVMSTTITGGSSYVSTSLPSTQIMGWTWSGNQNSASVAVEIKPSRFDNFPLLVNTVDTDLKNNARADGNDILFTSCDGVTKLNFEIENYTSSTGSMVAWVQVPSLHSIIPNDIIYMYYGNSNTISQQNIAATWDSNYGGVWHFKERTTSSVLQVDNVQSTSVTGLSAATLTIPSDSNQNRLLLVAVESSTGTVSTLTFNGQSLTQSPAHITNTGDSEIWYLVNPISTGGVVALTMSQSANIALGAYTISGVDQLNPIITSATKSGQASGGANTITWSTKGTNSIVIDSHMVLTSNPLTPSAGQTSQWNLSVGPSMQGASSTKSVATPQSVSMGWSFSNANNEKYAIAVVEINVNPNAIRDSTSNQNDLTWQNMVYSDQVSGQIDGSLNFDASNNYLNRTRALTALPYNPGVPQTASIWIWYPSAPGGTQDMFALEKSAGGSATQMGFKSSTTLDIWSYGGSLLVSTPIPSSSTWHYVTYTYDGNGNFQGKTHRLYIDGVQVNTATTTPQSASAGALYVGTYDCLNCELYKGKLDEFRISTTVRSASWIATEYANQNSPSTFYKIGSPGQVTDLRSTR